MIPKCTRHTSVICVVVLLELLRASTSPAQEQPPKAKITVTLSATDRNGRTRGGAGNDDDLTIGESRTDFFYSTSDGMARAVSSGRPFARVDPYQHEWRIGLRLASTGVDSVTFDVDWQRSERTDGRARIVAGDHRTVTLRQGERHVLDFFACSPADSRVANVLIEIKASPIEDPAYAEVRLAYDLWLVQQTADGAKTTSRVTLTGRQGEKVPFEFAPLPLPLEIDAPPDSDSPFRLFVSGTIAGRVATDGIIQVALHSQRSHQFAREARGYTGGTKAFAVKPEEAVSLELPPSAEYAVSRAGTRAVIKSPRKGVELLDGGRVRVDLGEFLAGAKTSIILTVHEDR